MFKDASHDQNAIVGVIDLRVAHVNDLDHCALSMESLSETADVRQLCQPPRMLEDSAESLDSCEHRRK